MSLDDKMTELADAIRSKTGKTGKLSIPKMVSALTSSETVYWEGDMPNDYRVHSLLKPIPAHTKISDIIITSDKPDQYADIILHPKHPDVATVVMVSYYGGQWKFDIDETELPDDLIGINVDAPDWLNQINNLKIVVKGADSGISELPTYTTVFQAYTGLANAIKKSTNVSGKLTIQDMISLITLPAFPSGTEILGRTKISIRGDKKSEDIPLTLGAVPPVMSKPIRLLITVSRNDWLNLFRSKLIFNKSDGTQLSLAIPNISTDFKDGKHWVETFSVTIPAYTSIANNKAVLRTGEYCRVDMIEKIIATY